MPGHGQVMDWLQQNAEQAAAPVLFMALTPLTGQSLSSAGLSGSLTGSFITMTRKKLSGQELKSFGDMTIDTMKYGATFYLAGLGGDLGIALFSRAVMR